MPRRLFLYLTFVLGLSAMSQGVAAAPQNRLDRADPAIIEQSLPDVPDKTKSAPETATADAEVGEVALATNVMVGAVRVEGATALAPADFAPAIEPYIGQNLDPAGLRSLAGAVAGVARARGHIFATAWIPEQRLANGVLMVRIDEGRVDAVRIVGVDNLALERGLARLVTGATVRKSELERALLIAGDIHGIRIRDSRYLREGEQGVLVVRASEDRIVTRASIDNHGSDAIGPLRARAGFDLNRLFAPDDRLRIQGVVTPLDPREFKLVAAEYDKRLSSEGTEISLGGYYARSRPSGVLRESDTAGESHELSAGLSHPVARSRAASVWATTELAVRSVEQRQNRIVRRDDKLANLQVGLNGTAMIGESNLWGAVVATRGLAMFDSTRAGDPLASRRDGSARFTKVEAHVVVTRQFGEIISAQVAATAQIASRPLLASEEFGIGGPRFGRGYDYSERLGDEGFAGSAELRFDLGTIARPVRHAQLYVFADGGVASNIGAGSGGGSLASAGAGARVWTKGGLWGGIEAAVPLTGKRFDSGDRSPRLFVTLGASF